MNNQYEQDEISLIDIIKVLSKRKMLIAKIFATITALAVLFAFLPFFEREKEFEAISSISILYNYKAPEDPEQIGEGYVYYQDRMQSIMVPTIRGYAQSLTLLRNIIKDLGLVTNESKPLKARDLSENIKIENQENSNVIRIIVKYDDEKKAVSIANLIPKKLIEMSRNNTDLKDANILIIDEAVANDAESSGGKLLTLAIGMVLGLMFGVLAAFAKEYMNKNVGSSRDIAGLGLGIEIEKKGPVSKDAAENILMLSSLSDAKKIVIAAEENTAHRLSELYISMFEDHYQKTEIINYTQKIIKASQSVTVKNLPTQSSQSIITSLSKNKDMNYEDASHTQISIISMYDDRYPVLAKQADKAFLITEQEKTDKKKLESLAHIASKYKLDISVIYLT